MEEDLALLECPFTWDVPDIPRRDEFLKKLKNTEEQMYFLMNGFCVGLLECFERARSDDTETAVRKVQECEAELREYVPVGLNKLVDKYLWERSTDAMWHVLYSTQAHLAFKLNDSETLDKLMVKIKPAELLDDSNQAAILGIKCRFFIAYGPFETTERAIGFIRKAIELDNSVPLWHFYLGKCLARYRRANAFNDMPSQEEIDKLEKAFSQSKTPDKGVMLLESYAEIVKMNRYQRKKFNLHETEISQKIRDLLNFIQTSTGDEWYIYWRCANLAMKMSSAFVNKTEIKSLVDMAVESSERNHNTDKTFLYSLQCKYHKLYEKDFRKALRFAEEAAKAGELPSCLEVILIKYKLNKEEDMIPIIDKFIKQDNITKKDNKFLLFKANYLMFIKNQVHDAFKIYITVMQENCKDYSLLNCRPLFNEDAKYYNLYHKLENRLNILISMVNDESTCKEYKGYLDKIRDFKRRSLE